MNFLPCVLFELFSKVFIGIQGWDSGWVNSVAAVGFVKLHNVNEGGEQWWPGVVGWCHMEI